uniref:Ion transport domain-containing protein n=1 Tax=Salix viminalis TaxID=40686 RepID=A0A6N2NIG6_SALVM
MAIPLSNFLRSLFLVMGCLMVGTLVYTIYVDGFPFRRDLLTPWMIATVVDFYINVIAVAALDFLQRIELYYCNNLDTSANMLWQYYKLCLHFYPISQVVT